MIMMKSHQLIGAGANWPPLQGLGKFLVRYDKVSRPFREQAKLRAAVYVYMIIPAYNKRQ